MTETPTSLAELAEELRIVATDECHTNGGLEHFLARHPNDEYARLLAGFKVTAARIGEAAMLLAALAPFEREVRALTQRNTAPGEQET